MEKLGKYEILQKIGEGGFGSVYKARDPHLKRIVALKTCTHTDGDLQRRFLREGEIVASLQHPNITLIHDLGFEGGTPFLVQEFLSGEDLAQIIDRKQPVDEEQKLRWLIGVARGLEYAHGKGIVHRDIKPSNIRILDDGSAKIMDFGIARLAQQETKLTKTGAAVGTIAYMSPEQLDGSDVDARSDIFAFGAVAYELFAYARPFEGETTSRIVFEILHGEPRNLATLSERFNPGLEKVLRGCLAKNPTGRFQAVGELLQALGRLLAGLPPIEVQTMAGWGLPAGAVPGGGQPAAPPLRSGEQRALRPVTGPTATMRPAPAALLSALDPVPVRSSPAKLIAAVTILAVAAAAVWLVMGRKGGGAESKAAAAPAPVEMAAPAPAEARPSPAPAEAAPVPTPAAPAAAAIPPARESAGAQDTKQASLVTAFVERAEQSAREARLSAERTGARERAPKEFAAGEARLGEAARAIRAGRAEAAYDAFSAARAEFEASALAAARVAASSDGAKPAATPVSAAVPAEPVPVASPAPAPQLATPAPPAAAANPVSAPGVSSPAETRAAQEAAIERALDGYVAAYERLDATAVVAAVPSLGGRRAELERAFAQYRSLDMSLERCRIEIDGERATATCDKRQSFELKVGQGRPVEGPVTFRLSLRGGRWAIDALDG